MFGEMLVKGGILGIGNLENDTIKFLKNTKFASQIKEINSEDKDELEKGLNNLKLLFIVANLENDSAVKKLEIILKMAKDRDVLTIVSIQKKEECQEKELKNIGDAIFLFQNEIEMSFNKKVEILLNGVYELFLGEGLITLDFIEIKNILSESDIVFLEYGVAEGINRAENAASNAIKSNLTTKKIKKVNKILISINGSSSVSILECSVILERIREEFQPVSEIMFGLNIDESLGEKIVVTAIVI